MRRLLSIVAVMAILGLGCAFAEETAEHPAPPSKPHGEAPTRKRAERPGIFDELSLLFRLQDGTAAGQADSMAGQKQLLPHAGIALDAFFKSASPEQMRLIAPDVAAYVLSGGDPATAQTLAKSDSLDLRTKHILEASAVFMQGDHEAAGKQFKDLDTQGLPARLTGRLALVLALLDNRNMAAKQAHLATAIAAMPGSLIEESALRRSALAYADAGDERRFWERIARYQRRFPKSLYAPAFWREVSAAVIAWCAKEPQFALDKLEKEWNGMEVSLRRSLYLDLTRQATAANERRVTEFAAAQLQGLSTEGSPEDQVAELYMAIYKVASPEGDDALRGLKSIRRDLLDDQDRDLLDAALAVSEQINRPLPAVSSSATEGISDVDPLQTRGQSAVTGSDQLLESLSL